MRLKKIFASLLAVMFFGSNLFAVSAFDFNMASSYLNAELDKEEAIEKIEKITNDNVNLAVKFCKNIYLNLLAFGDTFCYFYRYKNEKLGGLIKREMIKAKNYEIMGLPGFFRFDLSLHTGREKDIRKSLNYVISIYEESLSYFENKNESSCT